MKLNSGPVFVCDFVQYCAKDKIMIGKSKKIICIYGKFTCIAIFCYASFFFQEEQSGVFAKLIMQKHFILASNYYIINVNIYINVENIHVGFTSGCHTFTNQI